MAMAMALGAIPAHAQTLIIGNKGEDSVSFVDLASGREVARVATGKAPHEIAVSPDGRRAAVVAYGGNGIDLIDVSTARRLRTIDLGANLRPHGLVWLSDGRLVATAEGSDTIVVVPMAGDAPGPVRAFPTGAKGSHMVASDRIGGSPMSRTCARAPVSVIDIDGRSATGTMPVGGVPEGIALSPDDRTLWVADRDGDRVHVLDRRTGKELARMPTGRMPIRIVVTPTRAYVSNAGAGTVSVFDARTFKPVGTIKVSGTPEAMQVTLLLSRDGRRLYAAETGTDQVAEVDLASGRVLRRLSAGKNGDGLAISPLTVRAAR
jgi:YVTN family beta-propeller protein